jgi:hypothetical protein
MPLIASLERGMSYDRRRYVRHPTNIGAGLSANIRPSTNVTITDLSVAGCCLTTDWALEAGARVWIRLPGLESAPARVAWCEDRRAGLAFDHPLHPAVVARFAGEP